MLFTVHMRERHEASTLKSYVSQCRFNNNINWQLVIGAVQMCDDTCMGEAGRRVYRLGMEWRVSGLLAGLRDCAFEEYANECSIE